MSHTLGEVNRSLNRNREDLLDRKNVVATGIGYKVKDGKKTNKLSVICSVEKKKPLRSLDPDDVIPSSVNGVPTDVVEVGKVRALQDRTAKHRPAPGGVSIGHVDITAGTLGCLVKRNGETFILSNNHVLANSNDASGGDPIIQPGAHDGGVLSRDQIAILEDFVPISFDSGGLPSECPIGNGVAKLLNGVAWMLGSETRLQPVKTYENDNLVDAAIARPLEDGLVSNDILEVGQPVGTVEGTLGMKIQKSGRTTGHTTGEITQVNVTVRVQYGAGKIATFHDQLMTGPISQGGDSGSAVLDEQNQLVGLLFAGSDTSTIFSRIEHVFSLLGLTL